MKNGILAVLPLLLAGLSSCFQCGPGSAQPIYHFGIEYDFTQCLIRAEHEESEMRFEFYYTHIDRTYDCSFYFVFTGEFLEHLYNDTEFSYTDENGNEIVFDENGHYYFNGDKVIYISYENANEEIKSSIANEQFSISIGCGTFVPSDVTE